MSGKSQNIKATSAKFAAFKQDDQIIRLSNEQKLNASFEKTALRKNIINIKDKREKLTPLVAVATTFFTSNQYSLYTLSVATKT